MPVPPVPPVPPPPSSPSPRPLGALLAAPVWIDAARPPEPFAAEAGLRWRPAADTATGVPTGAAAIWRVTTEERYHRRRPALVETEQIAGPGMARPRFDRLAQVAAAAEVPNPPVRSGLLVEHRDRAWSTGELVDGVRHWQLETMSAAPDQLPATVAAIQARLHKVTVDTAPDEHPLAEAGVHLIRFFPALHYRARLFTALLQAQHDPRLQPGGDIAALQARAGADDTVFGASRSLFDGIFLGEVYLGPLLGALSPSVWAFSAHRTAGAVVYTLGAALAGTNGRARELLAVLPSVGARISEAVPRMSRAAPEAALRWWAGRLNALFGVLTDPSVFTDTTGRFHPPKQLHALLSIEQLFRRVGSIQTGYGDTHARRVLLFTVLDTLERLRGRPIDTLCELDFARRRLADLETELTGPAGEILLPAARRAVHALGAVQNGFYLARQLGQPTIAVPGTRGGAPRELTLAKAAAEYIKVLRDATHGHGGRSDRRELTTVLLTHHTGNIPHDLALLGYLYLLDLLTHPEQLAQHLHAGGRT